MPIPSGDDLFYPRPSGWENYPVYYASGDAFEIINGGGGNLRVQLPENKWAKPIVVENCYNVIIIGGAIRALPSVKVNGADQRMIYFRDIDNIFHAEGLHLDGWVDGAETDGIMGNGNNTSVRIQKCRIVGLRGGQTTPEHNHADVFQTYLGVKEMLFDRLTGDSNYQGIKFELTEPHIIDRGVFSRINIRGNDYQPTDGGGFFFWLDPDGLFPITISDFYIKPRGTRPLGQSVWPGETNSRNPIVITQGTPDTGKWPSGARVSGTVIGGDPPGGDWAPESEVGLNYFTQGTTTPVATGLPDGIAHRFRADDIPDAVDGAAVSTWAATVGGTSLAQATSTAQPVLRKMGLNGHSYIDFLGGDLLTGPAAWTGPGTVVVVARYLPGDGTERVILDGDPGSAVSERIFVGLDRNTDGTSMNARIYSGTSHSGSYITSPAEVVVTASHGADGQAYINGNVSVLPGSNTGVGSVNGITLGADNAGGRTFVGHVYEMFVWDRVLTSEERSRVHSYVQDTYGITVSDYVAGVTEPDGAFPSLPWDAHPGTLTTLDEETNFVNALAAATDRVRVVPLGLSAQGRALRAVIVGPPRSRDEIRAAANYMVMGSHHGDEWAGREALFEDMRDHALGGGDETVIYLPTVNPDGFMIPDRELANAVDPNRLWSNTGIDQQTDGTTYEPEQQAVRQAILNWHPKLILDTHEYGTSTSDTFRFDPGTTNATGTPQAVIDVATAVLSEMRREATDAGHTVANYTGTIPDDGATQAWKRGGIPSIFTESPEFHTGGIVTRRAQQLNAIDALRRWARKNPSTLATVATSAAWYSGYAPTVADTFVPKKRAQATLVSVQREALGGSGTSITIPRPQGIQIDDYMLVVAVDATETVAVEPTGWTPLIPMANIDFGPNMYVMQRWVDGSEPASWNWPVPSTKTNLIIMTWRGVDKASPMDVLPIIATSTTGWPAAPTITTVTANATVLSFGAGIGPSGDVDLRWTSDGDEDVRATSQASTSTNPGVVSTSRRVKTPGAVTPQLNPVETIAARGAFVAIALRPAVVETPSGSVLEVWDGAVLTPVIVEIWNGTQLVRYIVDGEGVSGGTAPSASLTGGAGGLMTDQRLLSHTGGGYTAPYHLYAAGLNPNKRMGLLVYIDGTGEYGIENPDDAYLMAGFSGIVEVAKRHNMVLLLPFSPDRVQQSWHYEDPNTVQTNDPEGYMLYLESLIRDVYSKYNIDRTRFVGAGYSSGAQVMSRYLTPKILTVTQPPIALDGLMLMISFGGHPALAMGTTNSEPKNYMKFHWDVGDMDDAGGYDGAYGALVGEEWYRTNGWDTSINVIAGGTHARSDFGLVTDKAMVINVDPVAEASNVVATRTSTGMTFTADVVGTTSVTVRASANPITTQTGFYKTVPVVSGKVDTSFTSFTAGTPYYWQIESVNPDPLYPGGHVLATGTVPGA